MTRKLLAIGLAAAVPAIGGAAIATAASTKSVKVGDNYFVRSSGVPTVSVSKGTTVRWQFKGDSAHNVTVSSGPVKFHSSAKSSGSYSRKLTKKGTYQIYCSIHGKSDQSMKLVVK